MAHSNSYRQRNRRTGMPDSLTQIAGPRPSIIADLNWRHIGPYSRNIVSDGSRKQFGCGPCIRHYGGRVKTYRPVAAARAVDHGAVVQPIGGDNHRASDLQFSIKG
jgi:hypothetical protein